MLNIVRFFIVITLSVLLKRHVAQNIVGIGIADVTGPAAGATMMNYGKSDQTTSGIHTRLYSRAFIFQNSTTTSNSVVFVSVDLGMIGHLMKKHVIQKLNQSIGYNLYREDNVLISATHTHSGPGGYLQYLLYSWVPKGFVDDNFKAIVNGIALSVIRAHYNMRPSTIYVIEGKLHNANINRSPTSYLKNPIKERNKYKHDTDHTFLQVINFI